MPMINNNIRLLDAQKQVMVAIVTSPTPTVYFGNIAANEQAVTAQKVLTKLGLVQISRDVAKVTDKGEKVMQDENLIDELGDLTDYGKKYMYKTKNEAKHMTLIDFLIN
jgi:hypothetical protein